MESPVISHSNRTQFGQGRRLRGILATLGAMLLGLALAACGGGSSSSGGGGGTTYTVSGTITGASAVTVTLSGAATGTTTTDANGAYSFASLANGSYTLTPSKSGYTFSPASTSVTVNGASVSSGTAFTAAAAATYALSGTVGGAVASGVTLQLSGAASASTSSDAGGAYSFGTLAPGTYTVTPALSGYTFSPASLSVTIGAADSTANNFTATAVVSSFSISGAVSGAVAAGVTVTATGAASQSTTTAGDGSYNLPAMPNGAYTLTPSLAGYTFNPTSHSVTVAGASVTGENFSSTANVAPTYTLSGTVTGPWIEKVLVTLSGAGSGTTLTDSHGAYSFGNLPAGSYTVTPALTGYNYSPASQTLALSANTAANAFAASSVVGSYAISGTISYAGAATGTVLVSLQQACCLGQSGVAATAVNLVGGSASYTIRGLTSNTYVVHAEMDTLSNGQNNANNPSATSATLTVSNANVTQNLTLADAGAVTPVTPTNVGVYGENASAMVFYKAPVNASQQELATSYTVTWGTDVAASTGGGSETFNAQGQNTNVFFVDSAHGMANGTYYFKMTANARGVSSAASAVYGPVTVAASSGASTVSGAVTYTGTATGPLHVGVFNNATGAIYYQVIASPHSPQNYSVAGVPNGTYQNFAWIDQNNDGMIDTPDIANVGNGGNGQAIIVSGSTTGNITLAPSNVVGRLATIYASDGTNNSYGANLNVQSGLKRVIGATLYSAPGTAVPFDLPAGKGNWVHLSGGSAAPSTSDIYAVRVYYSDGTSEDVNISPVAPIFGPSQLPTSLVVNTGAPYTRTVPQFQWGAPASPPASYEYFIYVNPATGGQVWNYPNNGSGLPTTQLNVVFDVDGSASQSALTTGTGYTWSVIVRDPTTTNQAQYQAPTYTP